MGWSNSRVCLNLFKPLSIKQMRRHQNSNNAQLRLCFWAPVSHRTSKTSLPLSQIKQNRRGSGFWKGGSGRVLITDRAKRLVAGKGKPSSCLRYHQRLRCNFSACVKHRERKEGLSSVYVCRRRKPWLHVAGQCSDQCWKCLGNQDKLSHSNRIRISALIWFKYLTWQFWH